MSRRFTRTSASLPALAAVGSGIAFSIATVLAGMAFRRGARVDSIVLGRLCLGAAMLWLIVVVRRTPIRIWGTRLLVVLALGALPATQGLLLYEAVARIPASVATLLLYTYPAFVIALVLALKRESLNPGKIVALALSLSGLVLILGLPSEPLATAGIIAGLLSAALLATWIVMADRILADVPPLLSSALLLAGGALFYSLVVGVKGAEPIAAVAMIWSIPIGGMAAIAVLLVLVALQHLPPSTVSIGSTVEPLSTTVLSAWLLEEALGLPQAMGGLLIVAGVITAVRARSPNDRVRQTTGARKFEVDPLEEDR